MIDEPRIALASSPREWAQQLHRHVADHGGARVRATVLHPRDALEEDYDVFVADDTTSFLSPRLVAELRARGRAVLGVFDPADPRGKEELLAAGVDDVLARDASPQEFVEAITAVAATRVSPGAATRQAGIVGVGDGAPRHASSRRAPAAAPPGPGGRVTAVAAACGGGGATEIAIALAAAGGLRGRRCVLVDADDVAPALAQRLGLAPYPNVRAALDALERRQPRLADLLQPVPGGRVAALPGIGSPASWSELRPGETVEALRALARVHPDVVVNTAGRLEDLRADGAPARYALARHVLASADAVVAVTLPTPVGVARLLDWVSEVRGLAPRTPLHVVCNRAPASAFKRGEVVEEITGAFAPASLWFAPNDPRVETASWDGVLVSDGPFTRTIGEVAASVLGTPAGARRRALRRRRRAAR